MMNSESVTRYNFPDGSRITTFRKGGEKTAQIFYSKRYRQGLESQKISREDCARLLLSARLQKVNMVRKNWFKGPTLRTKPIVADNGLRPIFNTCEVK